MCRLRTNIEEGPCSQSGGGQRYKPRHRANNGRPELESARYKDNNLGGVLPACCALPASSSLTARCSEGGRAGREHISILAQESAGPDSKPDTSRSSTGGEYSLEPGGWSDLGPISKQLRNPGKITQPVTGPSYVSNGDGMNYITSCFS